MASSSWARSAVSALASVTIVGSASVLIGDWRELPKNAEDVRIANAPALSKRGFMRGPSGARHTMVVFADFTCGYCRYYAPKLDTLLQQHHDLRLVERHYPQPGILLAWQAAAAAECAGDHGRYPEMRDLLYRTALGSSDWGRLAASINVKDTAAFKRCMSSEEIASRIASDTAAARPLYAGTPTVILDDLRFGMPPTVATVAARMAAGGK
jgi:protein-disulfide isomerase